MCLALSSLYFGTLTVEDADLLRFPYGLPGFEREQSFVALRQPEYAPLVFLQSVTTRSLCFLSLPVPLIDPHFRLRLNADEQHLFGLSGQSAEQVPERLLTLAILTTHPEGPPTANLLAPVVIAPDQGLAVQSLQFDSGYSHCCPVPEGVWAGVACS